MDWEDKELEFAEIADIVSESEYEKLDTHRDLRNDIVHEMDSVSSEEAEELDVLVSELLVRNINKYLEAQDVETIESRQKSVKFYNRDRKTQWDYHGI